MRYTDRIMNLVCANPQLSRIWVRTGDPRLPLKSIWIKSALQNSHAENGHRNCAAESAEVNENHLLLLA